MTAPTREQRKIARGVLQEAIAENFGRLGVSGIQIGSKVIQAKAPPTLAECIGAGDTIRVGDVVIDLNRPHDDYPHRIEAIFSSEEPGLLGPSILSREIDTSDPKVSRKGPTSYLAWGSGWRCNFKVLTQVDVTTWWLEAKKDRADGWHKLPEMTGRVLIDTGIPIEIERASASPYHSIKYVVAVAEQMLGFDITPCRIYTNPSKLNMKVKKAVRRNPPKI
ncbi:MAG: hypothetical protein A2Z21_10535 [Candidatus Fraserbacteria bacterium RBG_16_55_9]|uniref:Uncharacterized protein n=1 Tax=Fraserbacteria sp. (strain RBG_16_55_9) TaxID=1817864 RepID=A0A1F5UPT7_FRAXR|nr:MAG: hypothetical protein A2Z21_10535 [Candidatus Fraserbacteria bacterium RBG_16_55_9]